MPNELLYNKHLKLHLMIRYISKPKDGPESLPENDLLPTCTFFFLRQAFMS